MYDWGPLMFRKLFQLELGTRRSALRRVLGRAVRKCWPGFRLYSSLARCVDHDVKVNVWGKQFYLDLRDTSISAGLFSQGVWEPDERYFTINALKKGMVFVDIGAHMGYYAVLASEQVGENGTVIAFEPDPRNLQLFRKNVALNNCTNVTIGTRLLLTPQNQFGFTAPRITGVTSESTSRARRISIPGEARSSMLPLRQFLLMTTFLRGPRELTS